jgi:transcriptional regulator with XRE-family HTH domain
VDLARKAEINRGVLNQLWSGKTKSTPKLIGRLCAVLDRESAGRVLKAYLEEVAADARAEQLQVESENAARPQLGQRPAIISVTYSLQQSAA